MGIKNTSNCDASQSHKVPEGSEPGTGTTQPVFGTCSQESEENGTPCIPLSALGSVGGGAVLDDTLPQNTHKAPSQTSRSTNASVDKRMKPS